jgi:membrane protease YdiL (CAAX protease family)
MRDHLHAVLALILTIAIAWAALSFVPDLADRLAYVGPQAARVAEDRTVLLTFGAVIVGAIILAAILRQPITAGRRAPWLIAAALPAGALGVTAAIGLSALAGAAELVPNHRPAAAATLLLGALVVIWAAFAEELLFRGVLQPVLARAWGVPAALAIAALAFAVPHYLGGWRDPVSLVNIVLAGLWFGVLALRTGGLLAPTLAHFGWNGAESLILGASPNPGLGAHGSIADIDLVGRAFLGGSGEGLNASLTGTLVLAGLALACGWQRTRAASAKRGLRAGQ